MVPEGLSVLGRDGKLEVATSMINDTYRRTMVRWHINLI